MLYKIVTKVITFVKGFARDTKAFSQYVIAAVGLVAIAITLGLGVIIVGEVERAVTTSSLSAPAQTAVGRVFNTTYSAFQLSPLVMYGIVAGLVISAILGIFMVGGRGRT